MKQALFVTAFAALALMTAGCGKKEPAGLAAPAATLTISKASADVTAITYAVDAAGTSTIDMPAPKEHIKARTTVAGGSLDVDPMNLANTRGDVKIDLTTLSTFTFGDKDKDEAQTEHARTWLEAVVDGKVNDNQRWVVFAIRSIDGIAEPNVSKIPAIREGNDDVRRVSLTAHGDFLLHGRKSTKDAKLVATLRWPAGASPTSAPSSVEIKTAEPIRVVLAEHEVMPRDTFGKIAKGSFHLIGTKVAETADVSLDLKASRANKS